jgi:endonuclease YncB( thermonuclease family)
MAEMTNVVREDGLPEPPPMPSAPVRGWAWARARPVRVIDGDTLDVELDRGFQDRSVRRLRLAALNAPERDTPEGVAATAFVAEWLRACPTDQEWPLAVVTVAVDKYGGRYDAWVYRRVDGDCLNQALIRSGHARCV